MVLAPGVRMRLTYNVDKDKGFVNGNSGITRSLLRKDVFILQSSQNVSILVRPITVKGRKFLPVTYGWATTVRRGQGATLDNVGLWFDRRQADRGYAYVGVSRAKRRSDIFILGKVMRTDWRPVGGDPGQEQTHLSAISESSDEEEDGPSSSELGSVEEQDFSSLSSE